MGMNINVHARQDVSFLFSSLGSGAASVMGSNWLSDYASIKNGSYGKLMKAYFNETGNADKDSVKKLARNTRSVREALSSQESKEYTKTEKAADALKESADALLSKSLFQQKDITTTDENGLETVSKGYDTQAIYSAVNKFVNNYNSVVQSAGDLTDTTLARRVTSMNNATLSHSKSLSGVGISVNSDGTLALNKDTFMNAKMTKVQSLFNGNGSYAYQVSAQASLVSYAADNAVNKGAYTANGSFNSSFSNGNLFNSYF